MNALPIPRSEAQALLAPLMRFRHVALAVSGGPDSLALMRLAAHWRAELGLALKLSVLTVDHGLRASSRDEALMVGRLAAELGLPHAILTWAGRDPHTG
ncbi:MAG: tRNA lysidine(34) synthetase TilS, partial [Methyloceanibacter sp.]|nr:tRNA lysidine(34) synthetase TilS [Methyloceanibacter sp.]